MALQPIFTNRTPYGIFDGLDSERTSLLGGEVVGFTYVNLSSTELHAADIADGYVSNSSKKFPAVTKTLTSGMKPLFLADEGTTYYGQLFGKLVGSSTGQDVTGTSLGPHTTAGSGKVTLWDEVGFYTVTLDAVDLDENTGLQPTNLTIAGNAALYATSAGKLTPNVSAAFQSLVVARFIEFTTNDSKVTTNLAQISAPNSPVGSTGKKPVFDRALIRWHIET